MAVVFQVRDLATSRVFAAKVLRASWSQNEEISERFAREGRILETLHHPGILGFHGFRATEAGLPCLLLEWMPGKSLADQIEGSPLPEERSLPLLAQILDALEYAHQRGVVHRDLKPENILLRPDGSPILADFGIAKLVEGTQMTRSGTQLGTPHYMSPEQIRGRKKISARSDLYSLGVVAFEMATGKRPYPGTDPVAVGYAHAYEPIPEPTRRGKKVPEEFAEFLTRSLTKKVAGRFRSAKSMRKALEKVAKGLEFELPSPAAPVSVASPGQSALPSRGPIQARRGPPPKPSSLPVLGTVLGLGLAANLGLFLWPLETTIDSARAQALFVEGLGASQTQDWRGLRAAWIQAAEVDPQLLPSIRDQGLHLIEGRIQAKDARAAWTLLDLLQFAAPDSLRVRRARIRVQAEFGPPRRGSGVSPALF